MTCTGILSCGNDNDQLAKRSSQSPNIHNIIWHRICSYKLPVYSAFCTSSFQHDRHHKDSEHVWEVLLSKCDTFSTDTVHDNLMYAGQIESVWQCSTLVIFVTSIPFFLFPSPPFLIYLREPLACGKLHLWSFNNLTSAWNPWEWYSRDFLNTALLFYIYNFNLP